MENNSDRMGFALIALSVVAFVLLAVNGTLQPTVKGFFNGFKDWQTQTFDGINKSNEPNLVSPTDASYGTPGDGTFNQRILVASLADQTKTLQDLGFKLGDKLTVTADVSVQVKSASAPGGGFFLQLGESPWQAGFSPTDINGKSATYHQSGTLTIKASDLTERVRGVEIRLDNVPSTTTVTVSNVRFQNASGETK